MNSTPRSYFGSSGFEFWLCDILIVFLVFLSPSRQKLEYYPKEAMVAFILEIFLQDSSQLDNTMYNLYSSHSILK
jgi:hypothetical protein